MGVGPEQKRFASVFCNCSFPYAFIINLNENNLFEEVRQIAKFTASNWQIASEGHAMPATLLCYGFYIRLFLCTKSGVYKMFC